MSSAIGIHGDAGAEDRHDGKGEGVDSASLLVEAHAEVFGTEGFRAIVEGHHENADEDHRRDSPDPVEVAGDDAILGARGAHADDFLRSQGLAEMKASPQTQAGMERPARKKSLLVRM